MAEVVIFGTRDFASLARYYLTMDSPHDVVAFTVDRAWLPETSTCEGLPVVPLDELCERFPPHAFAAFAPMSARRMNADRQSVYERLKGMGYRLISYVSSRATCLPGVRIGENCFVLEDNTIQPFVTIGNNVVMWSGNHIGHHSTVGDHVFFASHVVLSGHCTVEDSCFFGVNATVRDRTTIRQGTLVGMGAAVFRDTEPWSVHKGAPARRAEMCSLDVEL
jgi:sugar O-acyltransferase (sialic acid O-acetyltransferase NeuD family)